MFTAIVVCSHICLYTLEALYYKQYGPRSDCSLRSSVIRVLSANATSNLKSIWIYVADSIFWAQWHYYLRGTYLSLICTTIVCQHSYGTIILGLTWFLKATKVENVHCCKICWRFNLFFFFKKQHNFKFVWCILGSDVKMEQIPKVEGSP